MPLSHGEAEEMIVNDTMPPPLREIWAKKSSEQKAVDALNAAVANGDIPALKVSVELHATEMGGCKSMACVRRACALCVSCQGRVWWEGIERLLMQLRGQKETPCGNVTQHAREQQTGHNL